MERSLQKLRWVIIYFIIVLVSFNALLLDVVFGEYIYLRVAEQHNTTYTFMSNCDMTKNKSAVTQLVAQESSWWTLRFDITMFIPASFSGILVTSWGDRVGRKVAMTIPVVAMLISNILLAVSVHLHWSLSSMYIYNFLAGVGGYYMTLLMQGYAFISDITTTEKRGIRMVMLDTCLALGGGIAGLSSGYWIQSSWFFPPILYSSLMLLGALLLIPLLPDSRKIKEEREQSRIVLEDDGGEVVVEDKTSDYGSCDGSSKEDEPSSVTKKSYTILDLLRSVWSVYSSEMSICEICHVIIDDNGNVTKVPEPERCVHGGGRYPGRVWRIWFYLIAYNFFMFVNVGTMSFQTIYFLSQPLCFTPVLIGAQTGAKFFLVAFAPFLVLAYQKVFEFSNNFIIITGFCGLILYTCLTGFAVNVYMVFAATIPMFFAHAAKPFIQAQISNMVSIQEHGAAFGLLSTTEILTFLVSTISFLSLYSATLTIFSGFAWVFAAFVSFVPLALICVIWIFDRRKERQLNEELQKLVT